MSSPLGNQGAEIKGGMRSGSGERRSRQRKTGRGGSGIAGCGMRIGIGHSGIRNSNCSRAGAAGGGDDSTLYRRRCGDRSSGLRHGHVGVIRRGAFVRPCFYGFFEGAPGFAIGKKERIDLSGQRQVDAARALEQRGTFHRRRSAPVLQVAFAGLKMPKPRPSESTRSAITSPSGNC